MCAPQITCDLLLGLFLLLEKNPQRKELEDALFVRFTENNKHATLLNNLKNTQRPANRKTKSPVYVHAFRPIYTVSFQITNYLFRQTNINYDLMCH